MSDQTLIEEYPGIISEIQTEIKKLENDTRVLNKLYVILDVLHDEPINDIINKHGISQGTAYNWIKQWNDGGMEALKRKKGSKGQSKLTDEQFLILDKAIQENNLKTAKEVKHLIETLFGVEYSLRSIERIMKKLDYTYTKPYKIYAKMPKDAEEQLKKNTRHLDLENFTVVFLDQTYCQNQDNSQRCYNKKGTKNIKIQPTTRLSLNAPGVQAINGKSFVSFLDNTKTFEMMKFMTTITIQNIENEELKSKLEKIMNNKNLELKNILNAVNDEKNYEKLLLALKLLSEKSNTFKKLFERLVKNPLNFKTKSNQVLENLQKAMLLSYFMDKNLQHQLIMEKPIAVILDNYSVHHATVFTELCNILNMDLIHLPPYSPKYNPIEQVWRTIKAKISRKFITSIEQLKFIFENEFKQVIDDESYWKNWLWKFL